MKRTSSEMKGALIGTLLGDSWISNRNEFGCEQISENLIDYKKEILESIHPDIKVYKYERQRQPTKFNKNPKKVFVIQTNKHKYFEKLRNQLYINGSKQVSSKILNKLTIEGLALWYMDDGYCDYKKSNNTKNLRFCTDSYDNFSIKQIQTYFSKLGLSTKIMMHKARRNYDSKPRVSIGGSRNMQHFVNLIYPYILPEFYYKIDLHYDEKTLLTKRCSKEYFLTWLNIQEHLSKEDIV